MRVALAALLPCALAGWLRVSARGGATLLGVALSLGGARAAGAPLLEYASADGKIRFKHPADFVLTAKPVKTHGFEVLLRSESVKGFNEGVTMDRVKIDNILQFASPEELGAKVVAVERAKDGVLDAQLLRAVEAAPMSEGAPAYELEYAVQSTRGNNHFGVRTSIVDRRLYVFTVQCSEERYPLVKGDFGAILESIVVRP